MSSGNHRKLWKTKTDHSSCLGRNKWKKNHFSRWFWISNITFIRHASTTSDLEMHYVVCECHHISCQGLPGQLCLPTCCVTWMTCLRSIRLIALVLSMWSTHVQSSWRLPNAHTFYLHNANLSKALMGTVAGPGKLTEALKSESLWAKTKHM